MPSNHCIYIPVIKGKTNDILALDRLSPLSKDMVCPLIEVLPLSIKTDLITHVDKFVTLLKGKTLADEIIVDTYGFSGSTQTLNGSPIVIAIYQKLIAAGVIFTPCYGFHRDDTMWALLAPIVQKLGRGFVFRVDYDDLDSSVDDTWVSIVSEMSVLGLDAGAVDIVVDLRNVTKDNYYLKLGQAGAFLEAAPAQHKFRSIGVVGSSALKMVSSIAVDGVGHVERLELKLWSHLYSEFAGKHNVIFGDYGVLHPDFSESGIAINANAKIRYTFGTSIIYHRGHGLYRPISDFNQYRKLAQVVFGSSYYRGINFSYGDKYLSNCASNPIAKSGNLGTWLLADMNHHIEYSVAQMARVTVANSGAGAKAVSTILATV